MFRFLVAVLGGRHPVLQAPLMGDPRDPSAVAKAGMRLKTANQTNAGDV
jgi:hypothetical protein